jgi:hypothetical protein
MTTGRNRRRRTGIVRWASCLLVGAALGAHCGSVGAGDPRVVARNQAATATCMRYQACGAIGSASSDAYTDLASCETIWQGNFEKQWPAAACENKINQSNLSVCISAIGGTDCSSILDILDTLYVKCSQAAICGMSTDAAAGN